MAENKISRGDLEKLKKDYEVLKAKYGLPSFRELNENFWLEEIAESDTEILVRKIRVKVGESLSNIIRFMETVLNPVSSNTFIFSIIKLINQDDKKVLSEIYNELMKREIKMIEMDLNFNEENEAKFIKETYVLWQDLKKRLLKIINKLDTNWDNKSEEGKRNYFG